MSNVAIENQPKLQYLRAPRTLETDAQKEIFHRVVHSMPAGHFTAEHFDLLVAYTKSADELTALTKWKEDRLESLPVEQALMELNPTTGAAKIHPLVGRLERLTNELQSLATKLRILPYAARNEAAKERQKQLEKTLSDDVHGLLAGSGNLQANFQGSKSS
ncbi:hypothetical protein [Ruegeria arenilitoris]|uniref:hypothetical protein n=1 Tax=Ruegeria arenilitoris TaxID=1173585 RepID=UPI00147ECCA2|nr:hypothetical protein [Ruegeria arenilitoris]